MAYDARYCRSTSVGVAARPGSSKTLRDWRYMTADSLAVVMAPGYFPADGGFNVGDFIAITANILGAAVRLDLVVTGLDPVRIASPLPSAVAGNTVVIVGDSISQQMGFTDDATRQMDISYAVAANARMGGRFTFVNNAGVGGIKSDEMLANMDSKVLAYAPDWCWMLIGANDAHSAASDADVFATFKASVTAAIQKCRAAGVRVLIGTILPTMKTHSSWTAARVRRVNFLNNWIKSLPVWFPGVVVADFFAAIVDPLNADGEARTGMLQLDDKIHPTHLGAWTMGGVVAAALGSLTPAIQRLPSSPADRYTYNTGGDQIAGDPLFLTGTGGTNSTSGTITGNVPAGMTLGKGGTWGTSFGVSSIEARADGFGNDWKIVVTNTGANDDNLLLNPGNLISRVAAGDKIFSVCEVSASGLANWKGAGIRLESTGTGGTFYGSGMERSSTDDPAAGAAQFVQTDHSYVITTGILTVPPNPTTLYCYLRARWCAAGGTGTFKVGRWAILKVPQLG